MPDDATLLRTFARDLGLPDDRVSKLSEVHLDVNAESGFELILREARSAGCVAGELGAARFKRLFSVFKNNLLSVSRYYPEPGGGPVVLMRSDDGRKLGSDGGMGWSEVARNLSIKDVPGDHYSIMKEPYVGALAGILRDCLDRAEAGETLLTAALAD